MTTNVTAKPVTFLHGTNHGWTVVSHMCSWRLSVLQENNLSNSIPHRVKCRAEAVKHLSRSLETWKMLKIILSKLKFMNWQNQWYHTKLCFNINLAMCGLPSNLKSSLHKTWQTLLLFLKPLQIQNLTKKKWGGHGILCPPPSEKVEGTRPPCPPLNCAHAPMTYRGPTPILVLPKTSCA